MPPRVNKHGATVRERRSRKFAKLVEVSGPVSAVLDTSFEMALSGYRMVKYSSHPYHAEARLGLPRQASLPLR